MLFGSLVSSMAFAQVDTARNVVHSTVRGTEKAARTVAHGVKKAADAVEDAVTPESDARRVDVTMTENKIDIPTQLKAGKTAFVVKNAGAATQNFEIEGRTVDRTFASAPNPGQTRVMHVTLRRGTYTIYSVEKSADKVNAIATVRVR